MSQDEDDDFFYRPQAAGGQRLDPAISRMALGAGALSLLIILVALGWSGFHAGIFGPPPIINPPDTPLRVAPASPGGLVVPGADVPIMSGDTTSSTPPELAPPGTSPDVAQLNQAAGLNPPPPTPAAAQPAALVPPALIPSPAALAQKPGAPAAVQLASTPDEGSAESAWAALQQKFPGLLRGKTPVILPDVVGGQSLWRLRLSGFASAGAAQAFCATLTAQGAACAMAP